MRRQIQTLLYFLCGVSLVGGLTDIAIQIFEGVDPLQWRTPIILVGIGFGFPIILFPFHVPSQANDLNYDDNDVSSVYQNDGGFLSNMEPNDNEGGFGNGGREDGGDD